MTDKKTVPLNANGSKVEECPYDECPNCGEYKFRVVRMYRFLSTNEVKRCKNCKYEEEV